MIQFFHGSRPPLEKKRSRHEIVIDDSSFLSFPPFLAFPLCPPPLQGELNELAREVGGARPSKGRREKSSRPLFLPPSRLFIALHRFSPPFFLSPPPRCCCPQPFAGPRHRCESRFNARVAIYGVSSARPEEGATQSEGRKKRRETLE